MKDPHGPEWLKRDMDNFFSKEGKNIKKFRWHVAGDLISEEHLDAIIAIAEKHGDIQFWLYTKNYNLVSGKTPPKNLVIILSAWNDFMIDEIERLHKKFPVAYLDDWDHKDVINKTTGKPLIPPDSEAYICPCADDSPEEEEKIKQAKKSGSKEYLDDRHCETCKTHSERHGKTDTHPCYMLQPGESLIFRKH